MSARADAASNGGGEANSMFRQKAEDDETKKAKKEPRKYGDWARK